MGVKTTAASSWIPIKAEHKCKLALKGGHEQGDEVCLHFLVLGVKGALVLFKHFLTLLTQFTFFFINYSQPSLQKFQNSKKGNLILNQKC